MPIYVYEPTIYSLDEEVNDCCYFEVLQSISEKPLTQCPTCQHAIHRAVTSFFVKENQSSSKATAEALQSMNSQQTSSSSARNAARLASRHVCGSGCLH